MLSVTPICNTPDGPPNIFGLVSKNSPGSTNFTQGRLEKVPRFGELPKHILQAEN